MGMERGKVLLLRSKERESHFRDRYVCLSKVVVFCGTFGCSSKRYAEKETCLNVNFAHFPAYQAWRGKVHQAQPTQVSIKTAIRIQHLHQDTVTLSCTRPLDQEPYETHVCTFLLQILDVLNKGSLQNGPQWSRPTLCLHSQSQIT